MMVAQIQRAVARSYSIPLQDLMGPSRLPEHSHPRQIAYLLAHELTNHSTVNLGRFFHRDHSTIISGIRAAKKRIAEDRYTAGKYALLRSLFVPVEMAA